MTHVISWRESLFSVEMIASKSKEKRFICVYRLIKDIRMYVHHLRLLKTIVVFIERKA